MQTVVLAIALLFAPMYLTAKESTCPPEVILNAQCPSLGDDLQMPKNTKMKREVVAVGEFRKSEGCMQGFRRLGYTVTLNQCLGAAQKSSLPTFTSESADVTKKDSLIIIVQKGDPFAVLKANGRRATEILLYEKPK